MTQSKTSDAREAAQPLPVSVVIAAYNRAEQLPLALESVAAQLPAGPREVIVVDDGSTDGTAEVARAGGATVIERKVNRGSASARNAGIEAASQPWIAFLDSDDQWLPHYLATIFPLTNGHVVAAGSLYAVFRRDSKSILRVDGAPRGRPLILRGPGDLYPENPIVLSASIARRDVLTRVRGFQTRLRFAEDLDLWLRMLEHGTGIVSPRVVVRYGVHPAQKTNDPRIRKSQLEIIQTYAGRPWWRQSYVEWNRAARGWDAARAAWENGELRLAQAELARIIGHPARLTGLVRILLLRRLKHRRFSSVDAIGSPTIGILPGTSATEMGRVAAAIDLRAPHAVLWRLAFRPPAALLVTRRWHRWLARIAGIPVVPHA